MRRLVFLLLVLGAFVPTRSEGQAVMRKGDTFELRLSGMPIEYTQEFALAYTISAAGEIRLPYIGKVKAAGLSVTELAHAIEGELVAQKIFTHPAVVLTNSDLRTVTVSGAVYTPQAVPWSPDMTISTALIRSGGEMFRANYRKVRLKRDGKISTYNISRADKDPTQNPTLLPGDEVTVPD